MLASSTRPVSVGPQSQPPTQRQSKSLSVFDLTSRSQLVTVVTVVTVFMIMSRPKTLAERCQSPGVSDRSLLRSSTFFRSIIESAGLGRSVLHGQMGNVPNDPGSFSAEPWWGSIQCASVAALASIRAQPSPALSFVPRAACQAYTGRT